MREVRDASLWRVKKVAQDTEALQNAVGSCGKGPAGAGKQTHGLPSPERWKRGARVRNAPDRPTLLYTIPHLPRIETPLLLFY